MQIPLIASSASTTPIVVIAIYLCLLLGLAMFSKTLFRGTSTDYFVASRSIGPFMLLMSVFGMTFIKKINTKAPFGEVILDNLHNDQDYFLAGGDTLKMIKIRLVNSFGHTIPIQQDWSFSLVFQQIS